VRENKIQISLCLGLKLFVKMTVISAYLTNILITKKHEGRSNLYYFKNRTQRYEVFEKKNDSDTIFVA
jgi:hypothetical protein